MIDLNSLIGNLNYITRSSLKNPPVFSIVSDSRNVSDGSLFVALPGQHVDGHNYIDNALDAGASVIVHSKPLTSFKKDVVYIQAAHSQSALSTLSSAFWGHPSKDMTVIGVTGTDGKSTTVSLIRQLLETQSVPTGSVSTVEWVLKQHCAQSNSLRQSTPEAPQIHEFLWTMKQSGMSHAVIEATSHGLSPRTSRLADVCFDVAVLTNITSEHLDFHGDLHTYRNDKMRLFQAIANSPNALAVLNGSDPSCSHFSKAVGTSSIMTYSMNEGDWNLYAHTIDCSPRGSSFSLATPSGSVRTRIQLPGMFNIENTLAAMATVSGLLDLDPLELSQDVHTLTGVAGRMEPIHGDMDFDIIVDYAHSPGSFNKVLPFFRNLTKGRLIVVFGSAGERDVVKRPQQGAIASRYADTIILANEDPRGENPDQILEDIAVGCGTRQRGRDLFLIPDREEAIHKALNMAHKGDLIILLGKGHERSIILKDGSIPWNEASVCSSLLQSMGYSPVSRHQSLNQQ